MPDDGGGPSSWKRTVRNAQYKLIQHCPSCTNGQCCTADATVCEASEEIYDVINDVREQDDLADNSAYDGEQSTLHALFPPATILCAPGQACKGCCSGSFCAVNTHQLCPNAPDTSGIKVEWVGPDPDPGPQLNTDYAVRNWMVDGVCLPAVELKTTESGGVQVQRYRVGRNGLDLGALTTLWNTTPGAFDIPVEIGSSSDPSLKVIDLDSIEIDAQDPSNTWSSARLEITGDLITRAKVAAHSGSGGRIAGVVAGTARGIGAYALGKDAGGPNDHDTLILSSLTGDMILDRVGAGSKLLIPGTGDSPGNIIINNPIDDPIVVAGSFSGTLCAPGLLDPNGQPTLPNEVLVAFAADGSGRICDNPPVCYGPSPLCYSMSQSTSLAAPTAESGGVDKSRYISFGLPSGSGTTAIRVMATVLNPPAAQPGGFAQFEVDQCSASGEAKACLRWVNACPGIASATFKCGTLSCTPEYRDWAADLGGATLHVTGDFLVPGSTYQVQLIRQSDRRSSASLQVITSVWGDATSAGNGAPDGVANVLDLSAVVDGVLELPTALPKIRLQVRHQNHVPVPTGAVNVLDISGVVDAVVQEPFESTVAPCD